MRWQCGVFYRSVLVLVRLGEAQAGALHKLAQ